MDANVTGTVWPCRRADLGKDTPPRGEGCRPGTWVLGSNLRVPGGGSTSSACAEDTGLRQEHEEQGGQLPSSPWASPGPQGQLGDGMGLWRSQAAPQGGMSAVWVLVPT